MEKIHRQKSRMLFNNQKCIDKSFDPLKFKTYMRKFKNIDQLYLSDHERLVFKHMTPRSMNMENKYKNFDVRSYRLLP